MSESSLQIELDHSYLIINKQETKIKKLKVRDNEWIELNSKLHVRIAELEAEKAVLRESILYCSGSCKDLENKQ